MSYYFFGAINREDLETYARYEAAGFDSLHKHGAEVLAASDHPIKIEGDVPGHRIVLMRFKDREALDAWYSSPEYQAAIPLRHRAADTRFLMAFESLDLRPVA